MARILVLEACNGKHAGSQLKIPADGAIIGRAFHCNLRLDEPTLTWQHCRVVLEKGE
jgi:hypothetical protein